MLFLLSATLAATVKDLVVEMTDLATTQTGAPALLEDWRALVDGLGLADTPAALAEYSRVRLVSRPTEFNLRLRPRSRPGHPHPTGNDR